MEMIEIRPDQLFVGLSLDYTLRDEAGSILLAKGQRIETANQLENLKKRRKVFVEVDGSQTAVRALISGLNALDRADAPIKDFSKYIAASSGEPVAEKLSGSLTQRWGDIESKLSGLLGSVKVTPDFEGKVQVLADQIGAQMVEGSTASQFLLFNRAVSRFQDYSVLHGLLCASLVYSMAALFNLSNSERRSLMCAAMTMNVAMTALQNQLAMQAAEPSEAQRKVIQVHGALGRHILTAAGVKDAIWLDIVNGHHAPMDDTGLMATWEPLKRMTKILQTCDRFTAAMSPRKSREGRTARQSVRSVVVTAGAVKHDEVGTGLVQILGLSPPGTYVKLANGETAVVVRRGVKPGEPIVASVLNKMGDPIAETRLRDTADPALVVASVLTATSVKVSLNIETMLRLIPRGLPVITTL